MPCYFCGLQPITFFSVLTHAYSTAGSDTTANSAAAILYWIYRTPRVLQALRAELAEAFKRDPDVITMSSDIPIVADEELKEELAADLLGIPFHDQVSSLCPYLDYFPYRRFRLRTFGISMQLLTKDFACLPQMHLDYPEWFLLGRS